MMNSKTLFYVLKRIGLAILTIWVVITITFFVMHAVPGGPFVGEKATLLRCRPPWRPNTDLTNRSWSSILPIS